MTEPPVFDLTRRITPGIAQHVAPGVRRIAADNPGATTFTGTNTYIVGEGTVAVIDPGPADDAHLDRLAEVLAGETVSHILVTHTHRDHSPLARALARLTGAPVCAFGRHRPARAGLIAESLGGGGDPDFAPDRILGHGETVEGPGWTLEAVHTPGHTANHLCFALVGSAALFSGDHVMGWSTTMVAPPDGDMADYLASLARLEARADRVYWPGHGSEIAAPVDHVRALVRHRGAREAAIRAGLGAGPASAEALARTIYAGLSGPLLRAATLTTLAHLIHLADHGHAAGEPPYATDTPFELT